MVRGAGSFSASACAAADRRVALVRSPGRRRRRTRVGAAREEPLVEDHDIDRLQSLVTSRRAVLRPVRGSCHGRDCDRRKLFVFVLLGG
jgi:hypothetical protein